MITPETRQRYLELVAICERIDRVATSANLGDRHEGSLQILIKNIFKRVVKVDTALPLLKSQEYPKGHYQLRSYGLVKGEREYGGYHTEPRFRYFNQTDEKLLQIIRHEGMEIASKLERMALNKNVRDEKKIRQLVQFIRDCVKVDFSERYEDLSRRYTPTKSLTVVPSAFMSESEGNDIEELKRLEIRVEPDSGSLRVDLICKSRAELSLVDSDSDYNWVNPLLFLRLDEPLLEFIFESLNSFSKVTQKEYSGGGEQIDKLVEKYGQYIVLEKLDDDVSK